MLAINVVKRSRECCLLDCAGPLVYINRFGDITMVPECDEEGDLLVLVIGHTKTRPR